MINGMRLSPPPLSTACVGHELERLDETACPYSLTADRVDGDVELEVSYQPHFNTITKTGEANFSKVPHAVAELVDNSIQARFGPGRRALGVRGRIRR